VWTNFPPLLQFFLSCWPIVCWLIQHQVPPQGWICDAINEIKCVHLKTCQAPRYCILQELFSFLIN
jgi:hypothetical protein